MTNTNLSLGDKIIQHLIDKYNDFSFHDIAVFLKSLQPVPTNDEIKNTISGLVNTAKYIKATSSYSDLWTRNSDSGGMDKDKSLDDTKVEVALTVGGQTYWSDKISKQQPTIHYEDKRDYSKHQNVGGDNYGQINQDSHYAFFLKDDSNEQNVYPTIKEQDTTIKNGILSFFATPIGQLILLVAAGLIVAFSAFLFHWV